MLARARDRVLERLYAHGLTPEFDLPGFLRFAGMQTSNRFRMVRDQVVRLRRLVQDWAKKGANPTPATHAYIDLIFAFGLARLGEANEAHKLRSEAAEVLQYADEIHSWLYEAFEFRVQQALDGEPGIERLPEALLKTLESIEHPDYLQHMEAEARKKVEDTLRMQRYKIDRLRQFSRILEPHEKIDSHRHWHIRYADELTRELARLTDIPERVDLIQRLRSLLSGKQKFKGARNPEARILASALGLAPRLGQSFGEELLDRAAGQISKLKDAEEKAVLLEKSLFLAAHYDRKDDVEAATSSSSESCCRARHHCRMTSSFRSSAAASAACWNIRLARTRSPSSCNSTGGGRRDGPEFASRGDDGAGQLEPLQTARTVAGACLRLVFFRRGKQGPQNPGRGSR